jgi:hypothetical protein
LALPASYLCTACSSRASTPAGTLALACVLLYFLFFGTACVLPVYRLQQQSQYSCCYFGTACVLLL